jgi:lysozyme
MKVSEKALKMIRHHEGVRQRPYRCPAKLWTIGVGHVLYPRQGALKIEERDSTPLEYKDDRTFSMEEVDDILRDDLNRFERGVERFCPVPLTQGQFDALVSFSFNLGLGVLQRSTLRRKLLRQDRQAAAKEILKYNKAGGQVLKGLTRRREAEYRMFTNTNAII